MSNSESLIGIPTYITEGPSGLRLELVRIILMPGASEEDFCFVIKSVY